MTRNSVGTCQVWPRPTLTDLLPDHDYDHDYNHDHQETLSELATLRSTLADSTEVLIISKRSVTVSRMVLKSLTIIYNVLIMSTSWILSKLLSNAMIIGDVRWTSTRPRSWRRRSRSCRSSPRIWRFVEHEEHLFRRLFWIILLRDALLYQYCSFF